MSDERIFPALPPFKDCQYHQVGMTLRDYFAAKAMQGFAASDSEWESAYHMALGAYMWADAMLKARDERDD